MIAFRVFRIFSQQGDQKALHLARLPNPLLHFQWFPGRSSIARVERAHSDRARSGSTETGHATLFSYCCEYHR